MRLGSLGVLASKRSRCFTEVHTSEPCLVPRSGATGTDGYASIRFVPTTNLHTSRNRTIQFFLRARKPGDPLLSGVSIRRLVQATVLVR